MKKFGLIFGLFMICCLFQAQPAYAALTSFPAGSIIVPMDPCWQPNNDTAVTNAFRPTGCETSKSDRGIFQAYGMVYEMLRNGANVAWVVKPSKIEENQFDLSIAGVLDTATNQIVPPVSRYLRTGTNTNIDPPARTINWTASDGTALTESFDAHVIDYRGGPFIIHKKFIDATMLAIMNNFPNVKVHVANSSFTAPIDKVLDKLPPKLAILGGKNTAILRDYLLAAGLGTAGSLVFEEVTPKQIIEDYLSTPDADGNTFSLFWAPHWEINNEVGATTLSNGTTLTAAEARLQVLSKLRQFIESGNSCFLECASLESMEGSENGPNNSKTSWDIWSAEIQTQGGWVTPRLPANWNTATPAGSNTPGARLWVNDGSQNANYIISDAPTSFLTQCAGWDYKPTSGHVDSFKPHDNVNSTYNDTFERFVHDRDGAYPTSGQSFDPGFDYFIGGRINGSPTQGYVSYLAGHRYIECNNSGTETVSGTPITTVVGPQSDVTFSLALPSTIDPASVVSFLVYYDGDTTPITGTFNADASNPSNSVGDNAIMQVEMLGISKTANTINGIIVSNMDTSSHVIDKINVTWTGCAAASSGGGGGSYVIKKEPQTEAKFCNEDDTPEGQSCAPDRTATLTKADGMQYDFEVNEEIADNDWFFVEFGYGTGQTATLGLQLDRTSLGNCNDKKRYFSRINILPECSSYDNSQLNFDLSSLSAKIRYSNDSCTTFRRIDIDNVNLTAPSSSSEPNITDITATWGAKDNSICSKKLTGGSCDESFNLSSTAPTYNAAGTRAVDLTTSITLEALNDGGTAPTEPPPDLIDVSYCDPNWSKTNTCGSRFVLNTVLGLQFTVISNTYVQSSPIIDRGIVFQGSYEFPTYRGHLQAVIVSNENFSANGSILWDAAHQIPPAGTSNPASLSSAPASRYIFTNNGTTKVEFDVDSVTQTTDFLHVQMGKASLDETKVLMNTIRGRDKATASLINGEKEQAYRLWGLRSSTPAVVGRSELANKPTRDRIVYVGGDDGMLHAFYAGSWNSGTSSYSTGTGKEIWAYIPSLLLPKLQYQNYVDPTKDPAISISGSPAVRDFIVPLKDDNGAVIGVEYRTILICTATIANQNKGLVFALDITNPYAPSVLWETDLSPYNVGDAAGVSLGKVRNGDSVLNWAFISANYHQPLHAGGNVDLTNGFYGINALALDVMSGTLQWQWNQNYTINNVSATPAIPSLLDIDNNGVVDFMIFGDMDGRLWQLDATNGHSVISLNHVDQPVFTPTDAEGNPLGAPIGTGIALYRDLSGSHAVFGTGGTDFADDTSQYGLYAVSLGEREAKLHWKAESTDTANASFLAAGEKIWGTPMIDSYGRIYVATGKGYQQQGDNAANTIDQNGSSSGRIVVLNKAGEILASVATDSASVGSLALADGGAVATDFTGNLVRLGTPAVGGTNQEVQVKVFSWRLR